MKSESRDHAWSGGIIAVGVVFVVGMLVFILFLDSGPPNVDPGGLSARLDTETRRAGGNASPASASADMNSRPPENSEPVQVPRRVLVEQTVPRVAANSSEAPSIISGFVRDIQGSPIRSARIIGMSRGAKRLQCSGTTDQTGFFMIPVRIQGDLRVQCSAPTYSTEFADLIVPALGGSHSQNFVLRASTLVRIKFQVDSSTIEGGSDALSAAVKDLKPKELPLSAIATLGVPPKQVSPMLHETPDRNYEIGRFLVDFYGDLIQRVDTSNPISRPHEYDGILEVESEPPFSVACVLGSQVIQYVTVREKSEFVIFRVSLEKLIEQMGSICMKFIDVDSNAPVEGVYVEIANNSLPRRKYWAKSDAAGVCVIENVPGDFYRVSCYKKRTRTEDYAEVMFDVNVKERAKRDLGTIHLGKGVVLRGTIVNVSGERFSGTLCIRPRAAILDIEGNPARNGSSGTGISIDSDGGFVTNRLSPGEYVLSSGRSMFSTGGSSVPVKHWIVDTHVQGEAGLSLVVPAGQEIIIERETGDSLIKTWICDDVGNVVWSWKALGIDHVATCHLADGSYVLYVTDGLGPPSKQTFEVAGKPLTLKIQ